MKTLLHNLVIVLPLEMEDMDKSGITIPASAEDTQRYGKLAFVGEEITNLKPEDKVLWKKGAGEDIFIDNVPHILMTYKDIIGTV